MIDDNTLRAFIGLAGAVLGAFIAALFPYLSQLRTDKRESVAEVEKARLVRIRRMDERERLFWERADEYQEKLEAHNRALETSILALQDRLTAIEDENEDMAKLISMQRETIVSLQSQMRHLSSENDKLKRELERLSRENEDLRAQVNGKAEK